MQCPNCAFENMPGKTSCGRCGAILTAQPGSKPSDFMPPRAGKLKLIRPALYLWQRLLSLFPRDMPDRIARLFRGDTALPAKCLAALFLSIIPGLGHMFSGRRRAGLIAAGAWGVLVIFTLNFYYGMIGGLLAGFMIACHAGIIFEAGQVQEHTRNIGSRVRYFLPIFLMCTFGYIMLYLLIRSYLGLVDVSFDYNQLGIRQGDILITWNENTDLRRGDIVTFPSTDGVGNVYLGRETYVSFNIRGVLVSLVVALPGDRITVGPEGMAINGKLIKMPIDNIPLPSRRLELHLQENQILALAPVTRSPQAAIPLIWKRVYIRSRYRVSGRAFGIYLPLTRRRLFGRMSSP